MAAKLIVTKNKQEVNQIHLERTVITIGRKHVNDLHLDDLSVSGSHAKILTVGNDSFIEDLNSTNGTFLNGNRVTKSPLSNNDVIRIGEYELRYQNSVASVDSDMEKTVILQAGAVTMADPERAKAAAAPSAAAANTASGEGEAKLTVVNGPSKGKFLVLSKLLTRVKGPQGQSNMISKKDDGYYLLNTLPESLAPAINSKTAKVGSIKLNDGDVISMGDSQLRFSLK